ncbi:MAG: serine hydrolase domain-containing protein [Eubacteriales bacterium]
MNIKNIESLIKYDFSGCIYIGKNNVPVYQKPFGYMDLANKIPNELNTRFATASAGKVFTAVGIMQLIEKGVLAFHDTIGNFLDFDLKAIDSKVTIQQLLCHTSGIPDYFDESVLSDYSELWSDYPNYKIRKSIDLLPLFINKPMMYTKGSGFQYNNTGFVLLGLIIEKVTGILFDEYLTENVFKPGGMPDTGYYELDRLPAKCANSYIYDRNKGEYYTNIYSVDVKGSGAGGAFSTVSDIGNFWTSLFSGILVSKKMLKAMLEPQANDGNAYYGYGIWLNKNTNNTFTPYLQGCDPGVSFISGYNTEENKIITLISNFGCNVWDLYNQIIKLQDY